MFVDRARIRVIGGKGGDGCCSFRREKYVPLGGPNGGDGGNGGDVYIAASSRLTSLLDLQYHSTWKGERGVHGMGSDCHGKTGADVFIQVPCGTVVHDFETGEPLADLTEDGQRFRAARGGRGGRGNPRFATNANRAPHFAEKGEPGEDREYVLELKTIAEVGLVGLPNAGKSTLLAAITAATPKIADYPFTTLSPNLGIAKLDGYRTLSIADIPGIIEGAAEGKGLGHDFLRHIERTRVLLFLIDAGDEDPVVTRAVLEAELDAHSPVFQTRPRVYALNKMDITENRARMDALRETFPGAHFISGAAHEALEPLLEELWQHADRVRRREEAEAAELPAEPDREYTYSAPYDLEPVPDGYRVTGERVVRAVRMTDFENEEAVRHFQETLRKMGIFKSLKRLGAQPGCTIHIADIELEYQPD